MEHFKYTCQKLTIENEFCSNDFAGFHDAIIDATDKHLNQEELIEVWNILPTHIKTTAIEWGMQDTEFKDEVYVWSKENIEKLDKYTTWKD